MRKHILSVIVCFMLTIGLFACGGDGGSTPSVTPPYIMATLISFPTGSAPANFKNAMVVVQRSENGINITNATVTMNGVTLVYDPSPNHEEYEGTITITPGNTVTLTVNIDGNIYTASGTQFTSYPTISSPASGALWQANNINYISWSGGTPNTNTAYVFGVLNAADPNGQLIWPTGSSDNLMAVPISTTSYPIPASAISSGSRLIIVCLAMNASIPNTAANSVLGVGGCNYVSITVN